jgi:hypothetical protein
MVEATRTALGESVGGTVGEADIIVPGSLTGSGATRAGATVYATHDIEVVAGRTYSLLAYGDLDGSLSIALFRDGKGLGGAGGGRWFAETVFTAEKDETLQLRILGPSSAPIDYKLYVFSAEQPATAAASE